MTTKGSPARLTSKWKACETSQREYLAPSFLELCSDIVLWAVVVDLIRTRAVSKESIVISEASRKKNSSDKAFSFYTSHVAREVLLKRLFTQIRLIILLGCPFLQVGICSCILTLATAFDIVGILARNSHLIFLVFYFLCNWFNFDQKAFINHYLKKDKNQTAFIHFK